MKLPSVDMSDSVAWHYEKSSLFSIKSAYRSALMTDHDLGSSGSSTVPDGGRMI
jgi:predicted secreted protein